MIRRRFAAQVRIYRFIQLVDKLHYLNYEICLCVCVCWGGLFNLLAYHTVPPDYPYVVSNKSLVNIECVLMHKSIKKTQH